MSSANSDSFSSYLPVWMHLISFFFFFCMNAMASNTIFTRGGESGHPCLIPDFRGKAFKFSLLSMMLVVG